MASTSEATSTSEAPRLFFLSLGQHHVGVSRLLVERQKTHTNKNTNMLGKSCQNDIFTGGLADGSGTVEFVSKFCTGWYGREIQGSHGEPFGDDFCFSCRWQFPGESFFELPPSARKVQRVVVDGDRSS